MKYDLKEVIGDRVVVKRAMEKITTLELPEGVRRFSVFGEVVAIGPGALRPFPFSLGEDLHLVHRFPMQLLPIREEC